VSGYDNYYGTQSYDDEYGQGGGSTYASAPRRRRGRGWLIALVIIVILLVAADFVARFVAQDVAATEFQKQGDLSAKPSVSIEGFPFLTQVASRDFSDIKVSASNEREGPVTVTSFNATATNVKISSFSFSGGTIGQVNGTALIGFSSVANALTTEVGPLGSLLGGAGLQLTDAGPNEVKASINLVVTSGSATWRVTRAGPQQLNLGLVSSTGLPSSLLGSMQSVNIPIPKLPLGLTIDSVAVTPEGVVGSFSGTNVPFGS
jgi:LmeA-like phospholipid-binding